MATRIKALVKPEILVWARNSAGFNLSEAAAKIDVAEEKLAGWEAGEDAPSIPQLRSIAAAYKRPLAVFYLQTVPTDFQVLRDLRRLPGSGLRRLSPALMLEVRRAIQRRELALEPDGRSWSEVPGFHASGHLDRRPGGCRLPNP